MNFAFVAPIISPDAPDWFKIVYIIFGTVVTIAALVFLVLPGIYDFLWRKGFFGDYEEKKVDNKQFEDEQTRCFRELREEREARINRNIPRK